MWTSKNRARYDRSKLRYPSDVTDEEWELIVPLIPPGKSGGGSTTAGPESIAMRAARAGFLVSAFLRFNSVSARWIASAARAARSASFSCATG